MKKEIMIIVADDGITLDCKNFLELTESDIVDSIKMLVSLAKTLSIIREGDRTNGDA